MTVTFILEQTAYITFVFILLQINLAECLGLCDNCREMDSFFGIDLAFVEAFSSFTNPFLISTVINFGEVHT